MCYRPWICRLCRGLTDSFEVSLLGLCLDACIWTFRLLLLYPSVAAPQWFNFGALLLILSLDVCLIVGSSFRKNFGLQCLPLLNRKMAPNLPLAFQSRRQQPQICIWIIRTNRVGLNHQDVLNPDKFSRSLQFSMHVCMPLMLPIRQHSPSGIEYNPDEL